MPILTQKIIQQEIKNGNIVISPQLEEGQISVASIDLSLGNKFRTYRAQQEPIALKAATDYLDFTEEVTTDRFILHPQQMVLGITQEKIQLSESLIGWLDGRSRFARLGLLIHFTAGFIQPGVNNHQVLEITNLGPNSLELYAGERICQLIIQRCEGKAKYQGRFKFQ